MGLGDEVKQMIKEDNPETPAVEPEEQTEPVEIKKSILTNLTSRINAINDSDKSNKVKKSLIAGLKSTESLLLDITTDELNEALERHKQPQESGVLTKQKIANFERIDLAMGNFCDFVNFAFAQKRDSQEFAFYSLLAMNELDTIKDLKPPEGLSEGYLIMFTNAAYKYEKAEDAQPKWFNGFFDVCDYGWEQGRTQYKSRRIPVAKSAGVFKERLNRLFDKFV